jgi:neutral ceramidase
MRRIMLTAVILLACFTSIVAAQSGGLRAGAAKVDITPKQSELMTPTDIIRDHLFGRAIVVDDGRTCGALIGFDLSKVDETAVKNGVARASASTGCPVDNFIVSATHNHSSSTFGMEVGPPLPQQQEDAIVEAVNAAKAKLAPARVGYATIKLDLNVNRERFNPKDQSWQQEANPDAPSDKTLAVIEFLGADGIPIGVLMNYGMHAINFFLTGVISADFPGEASRYIEKLYDNRTVAIYSQAPEGDQNPMFGEFAASRVASGQDLVEKLDGSTVYATPMRPFGVTSSPGGGGGNNGAPPAQGAGGRGAPPAAAQGGGPRLGGGRTLPRNPVPPQRMEDYKRAIELTGANVAMMGTLIGANTMRLMRDVIKPVDNALIWGARDTAACTTIGPARLDAPNAAVRERTVPLGLLRIGDIYLAAVNAEIYTEIGMHLKAASPAAKTVVIALGYGSGGYIRSDNALSHLTPQNAGSPQSACEAGIIAKELELIQRSGNKDKQ